jgi:MFS family permease
LGATFATGLLFWVSLASLLPTIPLYVKATGVGDDLVGVVMASFAIGLLLFRQQFGRLSDQRGRKIVLMIGITVAAIAPLCHLLTQSIPLLILVRAFHGLSIAAFTTAYSSLVADLAPPENRGEIIGYMSLTNPVGMAIGPALGGYLQSDSFTRPFIFASIMGVLSFMCVLQVRSPKVTPPPQDQAKQVFWRLLLSDRIRIPTVTMLLVGIAFGAISTFVPLHIKQSGVPLNPGLFYTAAAMGSFGCRVLAGRASDRYGRGLFISLGLACYMLALLMLWQSDRAVFFLIAGTLEGIGGGLFLPIMVALVADRCYPYERGRIFGLFISGFDLGIAIAGPILGSVSKSIGYRGLYGIASLVALAALVVFVTLSSKTVGQSLRFALGGGQDLYALPKEATIAN